MKAPIAGDDARNARHRGLGVAVKVARTFEPFVPTP